MGLPRPEPFCGIVEFFQDHACEVSNNVTLGVEIAIGIGIASLFFIFQRRQNKKINEITNKRLRSFYFNVNWGFAQIWDEIFRQNIDYTKTFDQLKEKHKIIEIWMKKTEKLLDENKEIVDIEVTQKLEKIKSYWNYDKEIMERRQVTSKMLFEWISKTANEAIKYIQKKYF